MYNNIISYRYANALFLYACKINKSKILFDEIRCFYDVIHNNCYLYEILHKKLMVSVIKINIDNVLFFLSFFLRRFIKFIFLKKRIYLLKLMLINYINIYKNYHNIVDVKLVSNFKIKTFLINKIISKLCNRSNFLRSNTKYNILNIINKNIICGFILYIGYLKWDFTINNKIKQLEKILN